ncbi:MAG TPA: hypothetical protein VFA50_23095 [Stellaceae bacterium]|nr:hypothetical protein [Stellaceae bacterium]
MLGVHLSIAALIGVLALASACSQDLGQTQAAARAYYAGRATPTCNTAGGREDLVVEEQCAINARHQSGGDNRNPR